jgi:hypothetical protein
MESDAAQIRDHMDARGFFCPGHHALSEGVCNAM